MSNEAMNITLKGASELLPANEWQKKLDIGRPLRIKLGMDPTAPDLHLGHTVVLNKMRQLQDLGHTAILLIGDFTASIGDPSGRNTTRPVLHPDQIKLNATTYQEQASKILDMSRVMVRHNSEWADKLTARNMIELTAKYTVARMLERNDFSDRYKNGNSISVHEFIYPLMQGYDSVVLEADLELGGTDQKFNLLMGRHLQEAYNQDQQCVLTMPLLVGTDGVDKMSKSKGNYIGVTEEPNTMFAKVMRISDELMWDWYDLLSLKDATEMSVLRRINPRDAKIALAHEITARFHDRKAAVEAEYDFRLRGAGGIPENIREQTVNHGLTLPSLLKTLGLAPSNSSASRSLDEGAVRIDSTVVRDRTLVLPAGQYVIQIGKRNFVRVNVQ